MQEIRFLFGMQACGVRVQFRADLVPNGDKLSVKQAQDVF